jgi:hypothetical protein
MSDTIIILGNGPSVRPVATLPDGYPVAAVSSGWRACPRVPDHFVTLDRSSFFPAELTDNPAIAKHVPDYRSGFDCPNTRRWRITSRVSPAFNDDEPIGVGAGFNSLLFAVQVAACMGYRRLWFVGCDLHHGDTIEDYRRFDPIVATLKTWRAAMRGMGFEWITAGGSRLSEFCRVVDVDRPTMAA